MSSKTLTFSKVAIMKHENFVDFEANFPKAQFLDIVLDFFEHFQKLPNDLFSTSFLRKFCHFVKITNMKYHNLENLQKCNFLKRIFPKYWSGIMNDVFSNQYSVGQKAQFLHMKFLTFVFVDFNLQKFS